MNVHDPAAGCRPPRTATVVHARRPQEHDIAGVQPDTPSTAEPVSCGERPFQAVSVFPADLSVVPRARRELHRLMRHCGLSSIADDVALGAQELMANAVEHGCRNQAAVEFTVTASYLRGRVRVEVHDASDQWPRLRPESGDSEGGRGLRLIDALAANWGVQLGTGRGKTVWMELDVPPVLAGRS
ncbi:ATP-binding protein [Streptomyces sp. CC208A]|uniref:ATP-binding protein n=1 Tax=Streptomyces sp. CC208A TaxID=3044573 RepID=UPI0024A7C232|nr:ATP-binding protein [Streptomyces sp. CC208A]